MKKITSPFLLAAFFIGLICIAAQQPKPKEKGKSKKEKVAVKPEAKSKDQLVEITTEYGKMVLKLYNETPLHRDNFIKLVSQGFYDSLMFHRVIKNFMIQGGDPQSKTAPSGMMLGNGDLPYKIPAEFNQKLYHKKGVLAAARDDNPKKESSACQFYIVQGKKFTMPELTNLRNQINYNNKSKMLQDMTNSDSVMAKINDYKLRGDKDGLHSYMLSLQPIVDEMYKPMEVYYTSDQLTKYMTDGGTPFLDMSYTVFGEMISGFNVLDSIATVPCDANNRPLKDVRMQVKLLK